MKIGAEITEIWEININIVAYVTIVYGLVYNISFKTDLIFETEVL